VARLLVPKGAVDVAPLQQLVVLPHIHYGALFEDEDRVGRHQGRQTVRDDNQRASVGDARDVGVDDRLAVRIQRACCFVKD
jgi:hypothetical protein